MSIRKGLAAVLLFGSLLAGAASNAAGPARIQPTEASMLVTGKIAVDAAGKVTSFELDAPDQLPEAVVTVVGNTVPGWLFAPKRTDGKPVNVIADMSMRIVAIRLGNDRYAVRIHSAWFGDSAEKLPSAQSGKSQSPVHKRCKVGRAPPAYPQAAAQAGVTATVYLSLMAGLDGTVQDVVAEQVNLSRARDEATMEKWRRMFADVAVNQARKWCIEPPAGTDPHYVGGVPVHLTRVAMVFLFGTKPYGQWEAYISGPRHAVPWQQDEDTPSSLEAQVPGRVYGASSGLKLLTELPGG